MAAEASFVGSAEATGAGSTEAQAMLDTFWTKAVDDIKNLTNNDFKNQELPLARIKKIMKLDDDVKAMMISAEAPVLFAKAAELFITELSLRAWIHTEDNKRRTLQRNDIAMAITKYDQFDFLIDIVPRDELKPQKRTQPQGGINGITLAADPSHPDHIQYVLQLQQAQALQQQTLPGQIQILQAPSNMSGTSPSFTLGNQQLLQVQLPNTQTNGASESINQSSGAAGQNQVIIQQASPGQSAGLKFQSLPMSNGEGMITLTPQQLAQLQLQMPGQGQIFLQMPQQGVQQLQLATNAAGQFITQVVSGQGNNGQDSVDQEETSE
ncbi:Nuclear transcription factor Y subunit gamma [Halotydeus destructor]|nr:Nuclear transcription factor Y subunit gamma [Halotydeus destructor]